MNKSAAGLDNEVEECFLSFSESQYKTPRLTFTCLSYLESGFFCAINLLSAIKAVQITSNLHSFKLCIKSLVRSRGKEIVWMIWA